MIDSLFIEIQEAFAPYLNKANVNYCLILASFVLGAYLGWDKTIIAVFTIFIYLLLFPIGTKLLLQAALLSSVIAGFTLLVGRAGYANILTTITYFLLVITIPVALFEYRKKK